MGVSELAGRDLGLDLFLDAYGAYALKVYAGTSIG
jgi:hypothetical protein